MSTASTLYPPPITLGTPKSVMTRVKTTKQALIRPYLAPGRVTVKKVLSLLAPRASAASYSRASDRDKAVKMMRRAWGNVQNTSPMTMPMGPYMVSPIKSPLIMPWAPNR